MKHSRIDYKNDIKVLGRVVSIATENKVAEAEQIFDTTFKYGDSSEGMNQYDINRLLKEAIINVQGNVTNLTEIQNKVAEIPALKSDMNDLKSRVSTLEGKVNTLESDVNELKSCCREVQGILENLPTGAGNAYFTVSPKSVELNVGDTANLSLELGSDLNGSFQFNGYSNIISVDSNGKITALATGETDITVSVTGYVPTQTVHVKVVDNTPDEPTPQPVSWVLNVSPASVSADVDEEFTITATDGTTNGGMNNIMIPSVPNDLTLVSTQDNGTNPLSKKFTFKGTAAGTYTIAVVGMANDIEVVRKSITVKVITEEGPQKDWRWQENPMTVRVGETIYGTVVHDGYDVEGAVFQARPMDNGSDPVLSIDSSFPTVHANEYDRNFQIPITGRNVGTQIVRAKVPGQDDVYDDLTVNVIAPVATLTISGPDTIAVGEDAEYETTISIEGGSNAANWSNGSPSIIDFAEGAAQGVVVTGLAEGTATITATSVNYPGIVATKTITVVAAGEDPQIEYTIEVRPLTSNVTANGDPAHILFYVKPDAEIDPETGYEKNRYWTFFVPDAGVSGIHGESLNEGRIDIDPADDDNDPAGITYHVYGIIASQDELSANNINWETWTLEDWNNTTLPKAYNTFKVVTFQAEEEPVEDTERHITFIYDPSTSNDTKIMSVDGSSKEAFTFENNGGYNHALMYGSGYGRMDDTTVPVNGSRTYTITIDNGYNITGIDPNFQYNTNATSEEEQRLYDHITYNIANDGKSMTLTVTDIVERDPLYDYEPDHHGPSAREYDLIDDCNGYLDIVILYEAA